MRSVPNEKRRAILQPPSRADLGRPLPATRQRPDQSGLSLASCLGQVAQLVRLSDLDGAEVLLDPANFGQHVLAAIDTTRKEECVRPQEPPIIITVLPNSVVRGTRSRNMRMPHLTINGHPQQV